MLINHICISKSITSLWIFWMNLQIQKPNPKSKTKIKIDFITYPNFKSKRNPIPYHIQNPNPSQTKSIRYLSPNPSQNHRIFLTEYKTFSLGEVNSWLTQRTITKHKGNKLILADRAMPTKSTNQGPNALEYVDALKTQTVKSHSHPGKPGTHTAPNWKFITPKMLIQNSWKFTVHFQKLSEVYNKFFMIFLQPNSSQ